MATREDVRTLYKFLNIKFKAFHLKVIFLLGTKSLQLQTVMFNVLWCSMHVQVKKEILGNTTAIIKLKLTFPVTALVTNTVEWMFGLFWAIFFNFSTRLFTQTSDFNSLQQKQILSNRKGCLSVSAKTPQSSETQIATLNFHTTLLDK